jgi:hypothetical protein
MPGNWISQQTLNNGRVERPTGPTGTLKKGFEVAWVQAWVVQGGTMADGPDVNSGSVQSTTQSSGFQQGEWCASEPGWTTGSFQPGRAKGIALMALYSKDTNTFEYQWWSAKIDLVLGEGLS